MVACAGCGNLLEEDARFCEQCGKSRTPVNTQGEPVRVNSKQSFLERVRVATASRFDVRGEIGRGGMAVVFLANDLRLNRAVALKVMLPGLAFTEGMSERFEQEARTAANLDHPNIVTIFSVEEIDDLLFFVMKYVQGRSLDKVTRDVGPLPIDVTQFILRHVMLALAYAHDERVVHRDVKPGNVLLDRRGTPIVTDFGIAKAAESPSLTVPGSIVGTPAYMSPEQFMGQPAIPASDQYALGIMAYEMLAGELPFQGTMVELQMKHIQESPKPVRAIRKEVSPEFERIVMRMLAKNPAERFPTLHDAEAALRAIPFEETSARKNLVELGFLTDAASPFGVPPTPVRSSEKPPNSEEPKTPLRDATRERGALPQVTPPQATPPRIRIIERATPSRPLDAVEAAVGNDDVTRLDARGAAPSDSLAPAVAYVRITPLPANVTTGEIVPLQGVAYDASNTPIPGKHVAWDISPVGAARIAPDGTLTALMPGAITVTARCEGKQSLAEIQVTPIPANVGRAQTPEIGKDVIRISTNPPRRIDERRERVVITERSDGDIRADSTPRPAPVPRAAIVAGVGLLALAAILLVPRLTKKSDDTKGSAHMSAVSTPATPATAAPTGSTKPSSDIGVPQSESTAIAPSAQTETAPLTPANIRLLGVAPELRVGERARMRAEVRATGGETITSPTLSWKSSDPSVVQVDATRGLVRALRPGRAEIVGTMGGVEGRFALSVVAPRLTSVTIEDARALAVGESVTLHLTAQSDAGALDATTLGAMGIAPHWSSSSPNVARIDARTGEVVAVSRGTAIITVEAGVLKGNASLAVNATAGNIPAPTTTNVTPSTTPITPPAPTPPPEKSPPRTSEKRARSESDVRREVNDALNAYSSGVSARDLSAMTRVFPSMQEKDRKSWRQFFSQATDVSYAIDRLDFAQPIDLSESGQVTITRRYTMTFTLDKSRGPTKSNASDRVTLVRGADGWHITQIQ